MILKMLNIALGLVYPQLGRAEDISHLEIGIRMGVTAIKHDERFRLYEAFGITDLPWDTQWTSGWILNTGLNINAGILRAAHDESFIGSAGPIFVISKYNCRFLGLLGLRLALLDDHEFGSENLGGAVAFIVEAGVSYRFGRHLKAGYQFMHMSNADIYKENPGLDLHVFDLKYEF